MVRASPQIAALASRRQPGNPHLVARFQLICGIRGTLSEPVPADSSTSDSCSMGVQRRIADVTDPRKLKHDMEDAPPNGAALSPGGESVAVRGSTLKPLRRNSLTGEAGQEFVIENRFLFYLFTFGTELGNELFYIIFFPFIMWNVDAFVSRRLIMVWVWVMYVGQCTKDVIGWPRPASPPVVKVEMFYNSEYSMPSTHAMSGTAIPFSLFFMTHGRWEVITNTHQATALLKIVCVFMVVCPVCLCVALRQIGALPR
uniref:Sphingosine-1-phosphate phosphatase 1 n=1 Tax=Poecilia mexicana TaxID=48701 RepID=A0A3B3YH96_9TELE